MGQLVIIVLAIALAALLVAGGVSYMSTDLGVHSRTLTALHTHHDALRMGASTYKQANYGYAPKTLSDLEGFIPPRVVNVFPRNGGELEWELSDGYYCLKKTNDLLLSPAISSAVALFSFQKAEHLGVSIGFGVDCDTATPLDLDGMTENQIGELKKAVVDMFNDGNAAVLVGRI